MLANNLIGSLSDIEAIEAGASIADRLGVHSSFELFDELAKFWGDRPALYALDEALLDGDVRRWSFVELNNEIRKAAASFRSLGVGPNDSVSLLLPNLPETLFAFFGAGAAGVANPLNPLLEPTVIARLIEKAGTKVLVAPSSSIDSSMLQTAVAAVKMTSHNVDLIRVGEEGALDDDFGRLRASSLRPDCDQFNPSASPAAYFHTGGTTGLPKLAVHSHCNHLSNAWQVGTALGLSGVDVAMTALPLFHVNAALVTTLAPAMLGAASVIAGPAGYRNPKLLKSIWDVIDAFDISVISGVPTVYGNLVQAAKNAREAGSLRLGVCGAAPMPSDLIGQVHSATGITLLEGYGLTEGTCVSTINPVAGERRSGSVGLRLPYHNIRIAKATDTGGAITDCEVGEAGSVLINGPNVIEGYKDDPDANARAFPEPGWLDTGDLGFLDAEGYLHLVGRSKDVIIRSGHNIDPALPENAVASHPAVKLAAAVGMPDIYAGELPVVFVELKSGSETTEDEILAHARAHVEEKGAAPAQMFFVDSIPLTAVGKIYKVALRKVAIETAIIRASSPAIASNAIVFHWPSESDTSGQLCIELAEPYSTEKHYDLISEALAGFTFRYSLWRD